ncbi:MAG: RNA polymerase-binding protein DksA [Desulfamplus sp.]|nr:RNA polymerase-binding protein DksA [Desulfamplus sp.]
MEEKELEFFKNLLTERLNDLISHADETVTGMTVPKDNFADPTDRASHEAERNFELRIRDREHKLIKKVKEALMRIENNSFGICETCGEDISSARLMARPVTTQCIECKTREEVLEKALGI